MKISDLQNKTIVNITNGKNVGKISDLEINEKGEVINIHALPQKFLFRFLSNSKEIIFKIENIKKIGSDVILVELD